MRNTLLTAGLLAILATPAAAHEKGTITVTPAAAAAGSAVTVRGTKLSGNAAFTLQLRGTLATYTLGQVHSDTAGRFEYGVTLPADAKAGNYVVVLLATDGDVSARADLVLSAASTTGAMPGMEGHAGMDMSATATQHPTAEMMEVPVNTSGAEWATIIGFIVAAAGLGVVLLVGARSTAT